TVDNESGDDAKAEIHHTLRSPDGSTVATTTDELTIPAGGSAAVHGDLHVATPMRWSVQTPSLYHLETSLIVDGQARDHTTTRVGIRTLAFDPDTGFALNGEPLKVKGVCLHHDAGVLGAAVPPEVWRERLLTLRQLGCNAIRLSHNPQAPALYDLCDELGFLVMDEAFDEWEHPKKKWITGWNKGDPGFQGSADFFAEWGERDLADMVRRDRNHPCVILWSIGNEVDYPNDPYSHPILDREGIGQQHVAGYQPSQPPAERLGEIATRLAAVVRREDRSRPVTAALAGAVMSNETEYPAALDVVGYNYTEGRYAEDHETYPDRVLYGSETRHDLAAWKAVADNDFIFGQFIWTGFDYLGESGPWPSRGFTTGMVDLANTIKPLGQFRRSLWSDEPMASLATQRSRGRRADRGPRDLGRSWNYWPDQPVRVVCFTNADEAELFLDGKPYGSRRPRDPETATISWDVSYRPGELQVVAFRGGDRVASDSIMTAGDPAAIVAESRSRTLRGRFAVTVLPVSIVDAGGHPVWSATNQITCSISGPGRLLGLENATPDASEDLHGPSIACRHGRLIAYVQAVADSGEIEVAFTAQGLEPARVQLPIEAGARIGNAPAP
ncbi:MAG: hypothetical protein RLZZ440_2028, partial [Planctomycetota bacterium]